MLINGRDQGYEQTKNVLGFGGMSETGRKADSIGAAGPQRSPVTGIYRPQADLWLRANYGLSVHTLASAAGRYSPQLHRQHSISL